MKAIVYHACNVVVTVIAWKATFVLCPLPSLLQSDLQPPVFDDLKTGFIAAAWHHTSLITRLFSMSWRMLCIHCYILLVPIYYR